MQIYFQNRFVCISLFQRCLNYFVVLLLTLFVSTDPSFAQKTSIQTVVIDAGHGGKDPGALGKKSKEKNITLSVALKTGKYIEENCPDVKVIYTRKKDEFIELQRRAEIANKNNADVFISIHCNAMPKGNTSTYGAETFIMGEHRSNANLEVAKLENSAILYENDTDDKYGGYDPNSVEAHIMFSLYQSLYQEQSTNLAKKVQEQFCNRVGRFDRGVQQAGFLVLYKTAMPSVLIELGFLTNLKEENFLLSEDGQTYMASAIYRAFRDYKREFERKNSKAVDLTDEQKKILTPDAYAKEQEEKKQREQKEKDAVKTENKQQQHSSNKVVFKVQFETKPNKIPLTDKRYKNIPDVGVYEHNGIFKYTSGVFSSKNEAIQHQKTIRNKGYSDAFVVAFHNDKRITIQEAEQLLKR